MKYYGIKTPESESESSYIWPDKMETSIKVVPLLVTQKKHMNPLDILDINV